MILLDALTILFTGIGTLFFIASTLGILRFPDIYGRLHALTKADNVGLGLIVIGLLFQAAEPSQFFKLIVIWVLVVISGAAACFLIAQTARNMRE